MRTRLPKEAFASPRLGYRPSWQGIAFVSLSINLLSLALPLLMLQVYDRLIIHSNVGTLNFLCLGAAIAIIMEAGLRLCRAYGMAWAGATFEHTVSCNALRQTLGLDISVAESVSVGEYLQRIGSIGKIRDFYSGQALATLIDLPFILVFLGLIAYFAGVLVLAPLSLLVVTSLVAWVLGRRLKVRLKERNDADDKRYAFLIHTLSGIHTVKALGLEALLERQYERSQFESTRANYHTTSLNTATNDQGILSSHLMMIMVAVFGAPLVLQGNITTGTLVACILLSGRIMQPVQRAMGLWTRLQDIELAYEKLKAHFSHGLKSKTSFPANTKNEGRLEINDMSFAYSGKEPVLSGLNLKLKPGDAIAVSGEHGKGKQTLLMLMAGMLHPVGGSITVNGVEPHNFLSDTLVEHVGYLPPTGAIFRGTIYENLSRFGRIEEARVMEMAKLLGIDEEIAVLPAGYDTQLEGGNADTIFPGLRQRIAIARALGAKPRLILFDNADQALDKEGYNRVYKLLGRLKDRVTMVLVSNDLNIRNLAPIQYVLDHGQLIETTKQGRETSPGMLPYQELRL